MVTLYNIHVDEVINSYLTLRPSFQGMSQNGGRTTIKPFTKNPAAFTVLVKCHIRNKIFINIKKKMLTSLAFAILAGRYELFALFKAAFCFLDQNGHLTSSNQAGLSRRIFKFTTSVTTRYQSFTKMTKLIHRKSTNVNKKKKQV